MSRSLGKIIDIIKAENEDSPERNWDSVNTREALRRHVHTHGINENELYDLLAGDKHDDLGYNYIKDALNNWGAEHNTPGFMDKVMDKHWKDFEDAKKGLSDAVDQDWADKEGTQPKVDKGSLIEKQRNAKNALYEMSQYANMSDRQFNKFINSGDAGEAYIYNPNFNESHIMKFVDKNPDKIGKVLTHDKMSERIASQIFEDPEKTRHIGNWELRGFLNKHSEGYDNEGNPDPNQEQTLKLNPRAVHSIIENNKSLDQKSLDKLLDHADPAWKQDWTDRVLGIKDGTYDHTQPDEHDSDEDFQAENWDNWQEGGFAPELNQFRNMLASGRHLTDEQAEHIKRHGDFEDKYSLYHNKNIDPRHGAEMFQKWHDDDEHHGYSADELIEKYKEDKDDIFTKDDLSEETLEEIRQEAWDSGDDYEYAEQEYPFDRWVDENIDSLVNDVDMNDDMTDEVYDRLHENYDDWTAENPDSSQNEGNPVFDALNKLHEEYYDSENYLDVEDIKNTTGVEYVSSLGLEADEDGQVSTDNIKEELDKFGGPLMIDYANHDEFSIGEHPEFDNRFDEAHGELKREKLENSPYDFYDQLYESYHDSDDFREQQDAYVNEYIEENMGDHLDELYDTAHQNTRFIPSHLHPHIPNFHELNREQKTRSLDSGHRDFLNQHIKNREYEHEYGDNQHHHEMVIDHAIANGGAIDIGTMNKLYPNQKDIWKQIFAGKGKITAEDAQQKLDELPKTKYEVSYGKWNAGSMQNLNNQDQVLFRLDHSEDSIKPLMDDPDLYETFKKVQSVSKQSGHPTRDNTIAWARVDTSDPNHWMIDEVQSDFGKTVTRYLKQEGAEEKASHVEKIAQHHKNWREALINKVLKEAKKHGAEKVSTHSPESKHSHAAYGSDKIHSVYKDSYKKVPRKMGFRPASHEDLPLTDKGREHFIKVNPYKDRAMTEHTDAFTHHTAMAQAYDKLLSEGGDVNGRYGLNKKGHEKTAQKHLERLKQYDPNFNQEDHVPLGEPHINDIRQAKHWAEENEFSEHPHDKLLRNPIEDFKDASNEGHTYNLTPKLLKKHMDYCLDMLDKLEKGELGQAAKGAVLALGLGMGAHYMDQDAKQQAAQQFSQANAPKHARSMATIEPEKDPKDLAYEQAKKEANDIIYRNDKNWFLKNHAEGLSPHVYKQTIKNNPVLNNKYGYINKLSNNSFREIIEKNPHLREDVHSNHYDKLHQEFGGDHDKMMEAWKSGIKATKNKYRDPASVEPPKMGEQESPDIVDETVKEAPKEPNFTHRRMFRTHK